VDSWFELYSNYPSSKDKDRMCWRLTSNGRCDVKSNYGALGESSGMMFP
jgi:hypothetical protein